MRRTTRLSRAAGSGARQQLLVGHGDPAAHAVRPGEGQDTTGRDADAVGGGRGSKSDMMRDALGGWCTFRWRK